jgi:RNA-binding protein YhbY
MGLTGAEKKKLRGRAQQIDATVVVGAAGVTGEVAAELTSQLTVRDLVKVRFSAHKEVRHTMADDLAARTGMTLIQVLGHTATFARDPEKETAPASS